MDIDYKEFGRRIAKRRKELGLKQYEACELINVNYKYVSNLETGRSVPSLEVVMNLCEALQTTPDYLLLGVLCKDGTLTDKVIVERICNLSQKNQKIITGIIDLLEENS